MCTYASPHGLYMGIETLIERAKAKDQRALETLYKMHFHRMLGLCIRITQEDENTAKDLVHDAFVLAFSSLHGLHTPERFGEWLAAIVRNVSLKYMARKAKIDFVSITDEDEKKVDVGTGADEAANLHDLLGLVDRLPDGYGRVFRMHVIDGLSHREIADILGIEAHSSSSQLSRAKAMLRKMIGYRSLAVVLLFLVSMPLYFLIPWERTSRPQPPKVAGGDWGKKGTCIKGRPRMAKDSIDNLKPIRKKAVTPDSTRHDAGLHPDTVITRTPVPGAVQLAEHRPDSTGQADSMALQRTLPDKTLVERSIRKKPAQWHILASGSLGPALAQNTPRLIATGKLEAGAEWPSFPEHVDTWEEYSRYLHMATMWEGIRVDTLALIEIADHNRGRIISSEQHDRPITFGISLNRSLSRKWSMEAGLQYSVLKSRGTMGNGGYYIGKEQCIHYLGIPIRMSYRLADYRRLSVYGSTGLTLDIPVYANVDIKYVVDNTPAVMSSKHVSPPVKWSTNIGLGVQYRFLPKWTLYVEPSLYWYIPDDSDTHTIWTEHPLMFSAPFGIRFTW